MTGGVVQGIRLCFNNHAPEQAGVVLAFFPAGNRKGVGDQFGMAAEEGFGVSWVVAVAVGVA